MEHFTNTEICKRALEIVATSGKNMFKQKQNQQIWWDKIIFKEMTEQKNGWRLF